MSFSSWRRIPDKYKNPFKAKGFIWHKTDMQNNHIPEKLRNLYTEDKRSKSTYHGWMYSYGLHTACTPSGFPVLPEADTSSVSEHEVIKLKEEDILSINTVYLVTDNGYTNFDKIRDYAQKVFFLSHQHYE